MKWSCRRPLKNWSRFSGRGWGQQLFTFQSPAVHWIARTSSLNCLSCRNPCQTPDSLNCLPPFHWKPLLFSLKSASSHRLPKIGSERTLGPRVCIFFLFLSLSLFFLSSCLMIFVSCGNPKPIHVRPGTSQNGIFHRAVPSRRRLPCLDDALPLQTVLSLWNILRKSSENWRVECKL